jgi:hypothetical protein
VYVFTGGEYTSGSPHTVTSASGTFSVSVKPTATTTYTVEAVSSVPWPYSSYLSEAIVNSTKVTVLNPRQTRVESFKVPATHEIHSAFDASGTAQQLNGKKWQAAPSASVALYDRLLPNGKWSYVATVKAGSKGTFTWKSQLHKFGKYAWQARVKQTTVGSTEYKASTSATADTHFVDRTYVTRFVALHSNGATALGAIMQDYPASGGVSYANVSGTAKFYYEPTGSKTWRYLGAGHTADGFGSVALEPGGTLDGQFKIVFAAQGNFLGSSATGTLK